ncbi:tetratricopeptide repeat-containing sensor histidine kinase [Bacteroides stercoris]|uniref:histidine kinase n=1 Tax=Bacteroides stercoris TaxID=46506 RepID=A0A412DB93_BACSE|nr:sensor histidine kinase [Bacteroides stercoris]MDC2316227.1 sensor histidine kinase [Bacteroides stercoris]MDC2319362.1 sensor histidine kinase [Bacteroides stercoris]MDC2322518.1 sensor histidine kinase [Bacteroides stercoris]MDC2325652.1 sensor histidine kinase [Bacteroides stercoris]MDC2328778.1 sensor histidine kinase [Bacteroides stercoris]
MFIFANNRQTKQTMRKDVAVLMVLWVMCIPYATFICASATPNKLDTLKAFLRKKILYDEYVPIDSVICWSENILPVIKTNNRNDENYFLLQLQLANAYTLRGDISLAIDRARLMYEEAKETEYEFGIAVANQAIGDAYTIANQCDKALDSYQDALKELNHLSQQHPYRIQLLLKISNALQRKGQLEKAQKTLHDIEQTLQKQPDYATCFFANIEKANYAISHGHLSKAYLKEAAAYLHNMDSIYRIHPEKFYCFHLKYTTAAYHRAMGNWNRMYWNKALQLYEELRQEYTVNKQSAYYRWITQETIYLYKIQGKSMAACLLYQELYSTVDTLTAEGYVRQINILRAKYQIDQMEIASREEHNKFITGILTGSILLIFIFIIITIMLRKQRQEIALSTQKLEHLRTNAENATSAKSIFLSNMSHEIRTPLNALSGFSSLLTEENLDNETRRQCNEVILQNSELLLKLINDVIDLSSLEFGKIQFCINKYNVVNICRNVIDTVSKIKQTQAAICFITELESMDIETDDARLQQVLINLLINATKFTSQGSIILELRKQSEQELLFSVTDTGCGIPKEKQAAIFRRFEKLNENAQGSGLGLSICQLIIEHIGGKIWIDSDYTGGSRFFFTHPIRQSQSTNPQKENNA